MNRMLQSVFFLLIVRPFLALVLGTHIRHFDRLPRLGPAILAANHNSHLDTLLLMRIYPLSRLYQVRPVAAADYFLRNPALTWFAINILHIIPLVRKPRSDRDPLAQAHAALKAGDILILFPEGTRGEPEKRSALKNGIAHLVERRPHIPIIPIYLHGLGKALPKGDWLPVPFFADLFIGEALYWQGTRALTMQALEQSFSALEQEGQFLNWE